MAIPSSPHAARPARGEPAAVDDASAPAAASVSKALLLLDCFRGNAYELGVSELARRARLPKSTAFRLLSYLEEAGYVERTGKHYRIGLRAFELGNRAAFCGPGQLREVAMPYLSELYDRTKYVVHLAILDDTDVVYLEKIHGHASPPTPTHVGARVPAACSGLGKAMLAFAAPGAVKAVLHAGLNHLTPYSLAEPGQLMAELARVRSRSVAFDREEVRLGLTCVAAPILHDQKAVAAISVAGPTVRFDTAALAPMMRRSAERISRACQMSAGGPG